MCVCAHACKMNQSYNWVLEVAITHNKFYKYVLKNKGRGDTDECSHTESNRELETAKINKIDILELKPHYLTWKTQYMNYMQQIWGGESQWTERHINKNYPT